MPSSAGSASHGARLAPLRPIYLGDDLFACHPVAKMVTDAGDDFIFTAKETSHKAHYDFIAGAELSSHEEKARRRTSKETFRYRWIEAVPIREAKDAIRDRRRQGKGQIFHGLGDQPSRFQGQRRRNRRLWPREMENRERELQRHEKPWLRARTQLRARPGLSRHALNLLAFAWHTVLELLDPPWQAARQAADKRTSFFAHILMLTAYVVFPSWRAILNSLTNFTIPPELTHIRDRS